MEEDKKKSIAVIGGEEFTLGFQLAGVKRVYNPDNYREKVQELVKSDDIGILVAEKSDVEELPDRTRKEVNESVDPVVVTLSEKAEDTQLQDKIKKVIGVDLS